MTDYMDDVEYLQGLAKRLGDSPENKIAVAYVNVAIQAVWDLDDPEGKADRVRDQGYHTTGQCNVCGKIIGCLILCERHQKRGFKK